MSLACSLNVDGTLGAVGLLVHADEATVSAASELANSILLNTTSILYVSRAHCRRELLPAQAQQ
jgi:hypothetical protein